VVYRARAASINSKDNSARVTNFGGVRSKTVKVSGSLLRSIILLFYIVPRIFYWNIYIIYIMLYIIRPNVWHRTRPDDGKNDAKCTVARLASPLFVRLAYILRHNNNIIYQRDDILVSGAIFRPEGIGHRLPSYYYIFQSSAKITRSRRQVYNIMTVWVGTCTTGEQRR